MAVRAQGMRVSADAARIKRVAAALRRIDGSLPAELRQQLREAAAPLVSRAKARVRAVPARTQHRSGLRRRIARGIRSEVASSRNPRVAVSVRMQDPAEKNIPGYIDRKSGWRHPVFGNRHVWVRQETGGSFFAETMREGKPDLDKRVRRVLDEAVKRIEESGR
jgi:hypothetical protein